MRHEIADLGERRNSEGRLFRYFLPPKTLARLRRWDTGNLQAFDDALHALLSLVLLNSGPFD